MDIRLVVLSDGDAVDEFEIPAETLRHPSGSAGQGHETLVGTVVGEVLQFDPDHIRVMRPDSLSSLPVC